MIQGIRKNETIVNYTALGRAIKCFCDDNIGLMLRSIGAGFLDGGCLPLALALKSLCYTLDPQIETRIVSIGRSDCDHAVLDEICKKMIQVGQNCDRKIITNMKDVSFFKRIPR